MTVERFFTIEEVADLVGYSSSYLRQLERRGAIPTAARAGAHGGHRIYSEDDVRELHDLLRHRRLTPVAV
jgi:DNA-binding transcriptional MerR regulator